MAPSVRRVVTGHDARGKSIIVSDGPPPLVHVNPHHPGRMSADIWRTHESPAVISASPGEPTGGPRRQLPTRRGTVVRINHFPPEPESVRTMTADEARRAFAALGNEAASTFKPGGRHPMMHRTETIDYAIVLFGEMTMLLDEQEVVLKAGDVLVQCGTNHAWSNRSDEPAAIAFVLIDGEFEPDLATTLAAEASPSGPR